RAQQSVERLRIASHHNARFMLPRGDFDLLGDPLDALAPDRAREARRTRSAMSASPRRTIRRWQPSETRLFVCAGRRFAIPSLLGSGTSWIACDALEVMYISVRIEVRSKV